MNKGLLVEALMKGAEINNRAFVNFYCTSFLNVCVLVLVIKTDAAVAIVLGFNFSTPRRWRARGRFREVEKHEKEDHSCEASLGVEDVGNLVVVI